jgi:penicillin-binding protein 1B
MSTLNRHFAFPRRRDLPPMDPARRRLVIAGLVASALLFLSGFVAAGYLWNLSVKFPRAPFEQPSRLYGQSTRLVPGEGLSAADVEAELAAGGYREIEEESLPLRPGTFRRDGDRIEVSLRRFRTPDGWNGGVSVEATFRGRRVEAVRVAGRRVPSVSLEPPLLASFYTDEVEERWPVSLDDLPEEVSRAVLAAEDDNFFLHPGVSPTGIARALWVNLRGGEMQQGGSTITQQLVKNVYLSSERTLRRKAKEAVIAMVIEARYGKRSILEAYLNEIYWGRSGSANLIGLGAAARAYFGKDASELTLAEAATLAGMIQAPSDYSPVSDPDKARERRDWVLQRMGELGWIKPEQVAQASSQPVRTDPRTVEIRPAAPYFTEIARAEAKERFDIDELNSQGYLLFSSIRWQDQREAEEAVARGLRSLQGKRARNPLQAALVSIDPRDGAILAWVGGRDYGESQFDRVSQARRQVGSTFKPVVYAAAFSEAVASPASLLKDSPINVKTGSQDWRPQNYDNGFRGWVTARTALEQSLNIPTVRLALQVGLHEVISTAHDMGLRDNPKPRPAVSLGAFEASPLEVATAYATLANNGLRPEIHGLRTVLDPEGEPVLDDALDTPRRVIPPQAAYLVTSVLQGSLDRGTAYAARRYGVKGPLAGKTGTTNDRRDNWFAGYSPDRVTVVWVGHDDNARTRLSGAKAALPIWSHFTASVRPVRGFQNFPIPAGIVKAAVDPMTGQLATEYCPWRVTEVFPEWQMPAEPCRRHSPGADVWANAGQDPLAYDPLTGEPIDPYATYRSDEMGGLYEYDQRYEADSAAYSYDPESYLEGEEAETGAAEEDPLRPIRPLQVVIPRPPEPGSPNPGVPATIDIRPSRPERQQPVIPPGQVGVRPVVPPTVEATPGQPQQNPPPAEGEEEDEAEEEETPPPPG